MSRIRWSLPWLNTLIVASLFLALIPLPSRAAENSRYMAAQAPPSSLEEFEEAEGASHNTLKSALLLPEWWTTGSVDVPLSTSLQPLPDSSDTYSYVNNWVMYVPHPDNSHDDPNAIIGSTDYPYVALGWIIVDMGPGGEGICDGDGNDFEVYEHGLGDDPYTVEVSNSPFGPWLYIGSSDGGWTTPFDLPSIEDPAVRFVRIVSIGSNPYGVPGSDIGWVKALHMCDPLTGTLPTTQTLGSECPFTTCENEQPNVGKPINTYSGNYHYRLPPFSLASVGTPLLWEVSTTA